MIIVFLQITILEWYNTRRKTRLSSRQKYSSTAITSTKKPSYPYRVSLLNCHHVGLNNTSFSPSGRRKSARTKNPFYCGKQLHVYKLTSAYPALLIIARPLLILSSPRFFLLILVSKETRHLHRVVE